MATLVDYKGLQVVSPEPTGDGGLAIQKDFKNLVDWNPKCVWNASVDPGVDNDETEDFYPGSMWLRTNTTPPKLFVCQSASIGAAVWNQTQLAPVTLGSDVDGTLPVTNGGTGATTVADAQTSLGLGTANVPQFAGLGIGAAAAANQLLLKGTTAQQSVILETTTGNTALNFRTNSSNWSWVVAGASDIIFLWDGSATAIAVDGNRQVGIGGNPTCPFDVIGNRIRIRGTKTPTSESDTGNTGEKCWDGSYEYCCTATNAWQKTSRNSVSTPSQLTANANNWAPAAAKYIRASTDAARNVTGLSLSQWNGQSHEIWNVGSNSLVIKHEDSGSTAANRFISSTGADITLMENEGVRVWYDASNSRWRAYKL